ncbi:SusC/RagA family TonB-linked outer membrane protein [Sphingobacterium corticibacterium]|uniref:TonB-dependent receptor n=1 Tax=Sphingobacterium corticibacterium TaxID=2484746 RepID=A0A4Q6XPH1_9SPHI|nr:TonB-dependent receptor [Sphingobacterium corticibacterium]RZF58327.1 TonB-dependent receptor [Sphingobacterium corticibacterium]
MIRSITTGNFMGGLLFLYFVLFLLPHKLLAQTDIKGRVLDDNGEPISGVSISIIGTDIVTATNAQGFFTLNSVQKDVTLKFIYIGYKTQELALNGKSELEIIMVPQHASLDEVVVIGYGAVAKSDLTGSVSSIKAEDLTKGVNVNVQQSLIGRSSGVQIYQKSGEPGAAMSVQIRGITSITGNNSPLYVIDGMPVNDAVAIGSAGVAGTTNNPNNRNPLNALNPVDIASIEILKDASATAIYGSRGANGVVLITTKKGKEGKTTVSYDATFGQQKVAKTQRYLSADEYTSAINGIIEEGKLNTSVYQPVEASAYNTDWQDLLLTNAPIQSHDISFSGGVQQTKYHISLGYFDQEGVMLNSSTTRYNARINLETGVASKYNIGMGLSTAYIKDYYNANGTGLNDNASALYMAQNYDPTAQPYNTDGTYYRSPLMAPMDNPLAIINGQYAVGETYRTFGNIYAEYFILPSLSARGRIGTDINISQRNFWIDPSTITGASYNGYADARDGKRTYYLLEGTLNYNKTFGKHKLSALIGSTYENYTSGSLIANARDFALPDLTYYGIGSGNDALNGVNYGAQENRLLSYIGRINYSFAEKYLFTGSLRADGSARFGPEQRFGYFPSGAFAWKIKQEDFLKTVDPIDDLKLRVSYGTTGNQPNSNYIYFSTYAAGRSAVFDGEKVSTIAPTRSSNAYLRWESANQFDIGLDFTILNSRISGSIDYYNRKTTNLLYNVPQPLSSGFSSRTENVGSMRNTGMEFNLNGSIIDNGDVKLDANFNITTLKNRILSLGNVSQFIGSGPGNIGEYSILRPGESMGSFYGYIVDGVWQEGDDFSFVQPGVRPGDLKYRDLDNNNIINANDRTILGKSLPDFYYGFNTNVQYRNLTLSIFIEGSKGAKMLNSSLVDSYYPVDFRRNKLAEPYLNRWTAANPSEKYPSFIPGDAQGALNVTNKTVEDASYLRLQSVRLSYNVPLSESLFVRSATFFINGQNLHTFTKYSGVDPAVNAIGDDILRVDYNSYPLTRTFTAGVNIQF